MALNITASLFSAFSGPSAEGVCKSFDGSCSSEDHQLLFGNLTGLRMQPENPKGRIIVFEARGGDDKAPGWEHRTDTIPICNSIIEQGWEALPVFYSDAAFDKIKAFVTGADGYISRVNPDVYEGVTQSLFEKLLLEMVDEGTAPMAHPELMRRFGAKDALAKIAPLRTGLPDTYAYYDVNSWREKFPTTLSQGPRVVKQNRGSQGEGIWICRLKDESLYRTMETLPAETELVLMEAVDNHVEHMTLAQFITFAEQYLEGGMTEGGQLIDQAFMPRIVEGEIRVLFVGNKPIEIVHKKPKEGGLSATLKSGAVYTAYEPDAPEFQRLMKSFVHRDLDNLLPLLGMDGHHLPLLWTADFILGAARPPWVDGLDYYFIGELNCNCVGITTQLHVTDVVAAEAIRISEIAQQNKRSAWPSMLW